MVEVDNNEKSSDGDAFAGGLTHAFAYGEKLLKTGTAIGGTLYLVGFAVVVIHLSAYGITFFSVFRFQYLAAGVWYFLPIGLLAGLGVLIWSLVRQGMAQERFLSWSLVRSSFFAVFFYALPWLYILGQMPDGQTIAWRYVFTLPACFIFGVTLMFLQRYFRVRLRDYGVMQIAVAALAVSTLFGHLFIFSRAAYPTIPAGLGGGKTTTVKFIPRKYGGLKILDLVEDPSGRYSISYELLLETEDSYVILSADDPNRTVILDRELLAGMIIIHTE